MNKKDESIISETQKDQIIIWLSIIITIAGAMIYVANANYTALGREYCYIQNQTPISTSLYESGVTCLRFKDDNADYTLNSSATKNLSKIIGQPANNLNRTLLPFFNKNKNTSN